jgi:branched-chain amino acid transport system ATP-binding protein
VSAPANETNALELRGVSSGYEQTTILRGIDLVIAAGSVVALLGPNGAGKTTLLKTVSGLIRPTAGQVLFNGADITSSPTHVRAASGMCHIPEGRGIFRSLTVGENLRMQALPGTEKKSLERAVEVFPILGERLRQVSGTLSGGQQQMLALARAYVRNPKLVLVDEASLGLAPVVVQEIFEFLSRLAESGTALLVVDQFVTQALQIADHAYVLRRGEIRFSGSPAELLKVDVFAQYLGAH